MHSGNRTAADNNEFGAPAKLMSKYLRYWPLFLVIFLLFGGGAYFYLQFTTPEYLTTARLLIKDERKGSEDSKTVEELNTFSTKKIIENELEVISSRTLLHKTSKKLGLYAQVFEEGKFRDPLLYKQSPLKIEARHPDEISTLVSVPFTLQKGDSSLQLNGKTYPMRQWVETPYGSLLFSPGTGTYDTEKKYFFTLNTMGATVTNLSNRLSAATASKESSIIHLELKDPDPERGRQILDQLIFQYTAAAMAERNSTAANTLNFIEERLADVEYELDSIENKTQQFRSSTNSIDIGEQGKIFLESVSFNDKKLNEINMQLAVLGQLESYVASKEKSGSIVPSTLGVTDPVLSKLVENLYDAEVEYETQKKTTAENFPTMVSLRDRINKIKPGILDNIQSQRNNLLASRADIVTNNNRYSSVLSAIPAKERTLIDINRSHNIKNDIYTFLLQKKEETALSYASTLTDSRVIDAAESSEKPVSPKKKIIGLSALLMALLTGALIVYLREAFANKIHSRSEIEKMTAQPVIGEIVAELGKDPIVMGPEKRSFIAEQFRKLRSTLHYVGINENRKRILVTSAISGEGKSFVATNLALSLAMAGKRVALLDFDLNKPSLDKKLRIENEGKGISEYLSGKARVDEIILSTDLHPDLFLLPAGSLPNNPAELMLNGTSKVLLDELEDLFDCIVVDSAPIGPVTDAYILSPLCDATLFVIRDRYTPKEFIEKFDKNNKIMQLKNVAIVFNGVRPREYGAHYGYGYGYGYNYTQGKSRKFLPFFK